MMKRREFITLLGGAAVAWPLAARAQQADGGIRRIAVLTGYKEDDAESRSRLKAFREGLRELGWSEGRNIRIDTRFAGGEADRVRAFAAELVAMSPEVILCGGTPITMALQEATRTIPIVSVLLADPVGTGLVANLARPGGNITGFVNYEFTIGGKWLDLLREVAANVHSILVVLNPNSAGSQGLLRAAEGAASSAGIQTTSLDARNPADLERAIPAFAAKPNGGMVVLPDFTVSVHRERLIALSAQYRLPAIYPFRFFAVDGGLIAYGIDTADLFRRSASYVDRILKGTSPADLPCSNR